MSNIDTTPLLKEYMSSNTQKNINKSNILSATISDNKSDNKSTGTSKSPLEHNEIDLEAGYQKGINWDQSNNDTLDNWIAECNKQQFIYEYVLDKIINKSKINKVILLILCALQTAITVSNLGIDNENQALLLSYKIILTIISTITYIVTQYATIQKYDDIIKSYTSFIETIDKFLSNLVATSDIKAELRPDGDKFILDNKNIYMRICQTNPPMEKSNWNEAINYYKQYLNNLVNGKEDYYGQKRNAYKKNISSNNERSDTHSNISIQPTQPIQSTQPIQPIQPITQANGNSFKQITTQ
jgi:hypothetical protein